MAEYQRLFDVGVSSKYGVDVAGDYCETIDEAVERFREALIRSLKRQCACQKMKRLAEDEEYIRRPTATQIALHRAWKPKQ